MKKIDIGFFGMSHLGIVYSAVASEKNFNVLGFDTNNHLIENLNNKIIHIFEKNLSNIINKNINKKLFYSSKISDLKKCKIIFVSQDVQTDSKGNSDLKKLNSIISKIIKYTSKNTILVLLSQVPPGFIRSIRWPKSKLYYQVETLVFGKAIKRAMSPERIIVGKEKQNSKINLIYRKFLNNFNTKIIEMNYESSELAKISINLFLISNISTANSLARVAENIGADWTSIIEALRLDKRIGKNSYIEPGLGLSGGNLERDLNTINKISKKILPNEKLYDAFRICSNESKNWVEDILKSISKKNKYKNITILGISYKEDTNSLKNSPSLDLIKNTRHYKFRVHDPIVKIDNSFNTEYCGNLKNSMKYTEILIIMNKSNVYKKISYKYLTSNFKGKIIIDPFGVLSHINSIYFKYTYFCIGKSNL